MHDSAAPLGRVPPTENRHPPDLEAVVPEPATPPPPAPLPLPVSIFAAPPPIVPGMFTARGFQADRFQTNLDAVLTRDRRLWAVQQSPMFMSYDHTTKRSGIGTAVILPLSAIHDRLLALLEIEYDGHLYVVLTNRHLTVYDMEIPGKNAPAHLEIPFDTFSLLLPDGRNLELTPLRSMVGNSLVRDVVTDMAIFLARSPTPLWTATAASEELMNQLQQGMAVYSAGYTLALPALTVSQGIIGQPRQSLPLFPFPVITTDTHIFRGNSGGPSFTADGLVIGINTMVSANLSVVVPITEQLRIARHIFLFGAYPRGTLGIQWQAFPPPLRSSLYFPLDHGARVESIRTTPLNQPLASLPTFTPLRTGDVVTEISPQHGAPYRVAIDKFFATCALRNWVESLPPGEPVVITFYRAAPQPNETIRWQQHRAYMNVDEWQRATDYTGLQ